MPDAFRFILLQLALHISAYTQWNSCFNLLAKLDRKKKQNYYTSSKNLGLV